MPVAQGDWAVGSTGNGWTDLFTGGIDEVAIFDRALTPTQIQAHFAGGPPGTGAHILGITISGSNATITWEGGTGPFTVQRKDALTDANWTTVGSPTSTRSATVPVTGSTGFFRIVGQ